MIAGGEGLPVNDEQMVGFVLVSNNEAPYKKMLELKSHCGVQTPLVDDPGLDFGANPSVIGCDITRSGIILCMDV